MREMKKEILRALLPIRNKVFSNDQHQGADYEIVFAAWGEIEEMHGHQKPNPKGCRGGCMWQMNKIVGNWLKLEGYDKIPLGNNLGTFVPRPIQKENLKPKEEPVSQEVDLAGLDWEILRAKAIELLGKEKYKKLNGKKPPSRASIVKALSEL